MQKSVFEILLNHVYQSKVEFSRFLNDHPNDFWLIYRKKFGLMSTFFLSISKQTYILKQKSGLLKLI